MKLPNREEMLATALPYEIKRRDRSGENVTIRFVDEAHAKAWLASEGERAVFREKAT